jgi:hypothetical protein
MTDTPPLIKAVQEEKIDAVRQCLEAGADINATDGESDNALQWAAFKGNVALVRLLIEKGADLAATSTKGSWNGLTAAELARKNQKIEVADILEFATQRPSEIWIPMGAGCVAHEGFYPQLRKRITQVFNFESRERILMTENLRTKREAVLPPTPFDALPQSLIEKALAEFQRLGGTADREFVLHGDSALDKTPRKILALEK